MGRTTPAIGESQSLGTPVGGSPRLLVPPACAVVAAARPRAAHAALLQYAPPLPWLDLWETPPLDPWGWSLLATWAALIASRSGLPIRAYGPTVELERDELDRLQRRTKDAFRGPVYRVRLSAPLLVFRFYGDLGEQTTRLYASYFTVLQTPGLGDSARNLLGLTGRNSANNLAAVGLRQGSQIVVGGITNRAHWADQILVEEPKGLEVIDNLARYSLPG